MKEITVLKTDETLFKNLKPNNYLTHYFKTKDNSLRMAFFNDKTFIAIETKKAMNLLKSSVFDVDKYKIYTLTNTNVVYDKNNTVKYTIYSGNLNINNTTNENTED